MKIGLGLYRHMLTREYYDFARQAGCTHVVVHLVDYFNQGPSNPRNNQPTGSKYEPWGVAGDPESALDGKGTQDPSRQRLKTPGWSSPRSRISIPRTGTIFCSMVRNVRNRSKK